MICPTRRLAHEPLEPRMLLTTFFVDGDSGLDTNPGTEAEPFQTVQAGIAAAAAIAGDDIVQIAPAVGGYLESLLIDDASGAVTLRGSTGASADVVVHSTAPSLDTISVVLTNSVTIEHLTTTGGHTGIILQPEASSQGHTADVTLVDVIASGNTL